MMMNPISTKGGTRHPYHTELRCHVVEPMMCSIHASQVYSLVNSIRELGTIRSFGVYGEHLKLYISTWQTKGTRTYLIWILFDLGYHQARAAYATPTTRKKSRHQRVTHLLTSWERFKLKDSPRTTVARLRSLNRLPLILDNGRCSAKSTTQPSFVFWSFLPR